MQAELFGKVALPLIVLAVYGAYRIVRYGVDMPAIVIVVGAVLAGVALKVYAPLVFQPVVPTASWRNSLRALAGLVPYLMSVFTVIYLGIMPLIGLALGPFSIGTLLFGLFWLYWGWRLAYAVWLLSEVGNAQTGLAP